MLLFRGNGETEQDAFGGDTVAWADRYYHFREGCYGVGGGESELLVYPTLA